MAEKLLNIATVAEYDDMLGVETLHPPVGVIDLSMTRLMRHMRHTFSFQYPQHFTRLFRNIVGITPNEFRNNTVS